MRKHPVHAPNPFRQQLLLAIPRLRRYARSLVFDAGQADDLVQNALERALTHWHQFDQQRDIVVWLLSIAHNAHLDTRRHEARMTATDPAELQEAAERQGSTSAPDLGLRIDLLAALRKLSEDQREPLLLVCVEQLSYAEAAEVMRVPVGTVMSRVWRARAALRVLLEGHDRPQAVLRRVV